MATKTKEPKRAASNGAGEASAIAAVAPPGPAVRLMVAVDRIDTRRDNPRADFSNLEELVESIQSQGVLQALLVREKPGQGKRYEIVAGERRYRAAKQAGLAEVPVDVRDLDDRQVRVIRATENAQRQDLDPIEQARELRAMLDAGDAPGPTELARMLSLSQSHVSNRLRLLKLPDAWQARVISGEMTAAHALVVASWKDHPAILKEIDKAWKDRLKWQEGEPSVDNWQETVGQVVDRATEPMEGDRYSSIVLRRVGIFAPTDEETAKLQIIEVPGFDGKPERRAANTALWQKLQEAHEKRLAAKKEKAAERNGKAAAAKPKPLTPEQQKRLEAEERKKVAERARLFARSLWHFFINQFCRPLIAARLIAGRVQADDLMRLLLHFSADEATWSTAGSHSQTVGLMGERDDLLSKALAAHGPRPGKIGPSWHQRVRTWPALTACCVLEQTVGEYLASLVYDAEDGPWCPMADDDVLAIMKWLEIDPETEWLVEQAGERSEAYWQLHTKEQLVELADELKVDVSGCGKKGELVQAFVDRIPKEADKEVGLAYPKELKRIKAPRE